MTDAAATLAVEEAITSRHSIRAFLPTPVPREPLERMLAVAVARALGHQHPAVEGLRADRRGQGGAVAKLVAAYDDPGERDLHTEEYAYYPTEWKSPFIDRRRKVGWDLYGLLGIAKTDKKRMHVQHRATTSSSARRSA